MKTYHYLRFTLLKWLAIVVLLILGLDALAQDKSTISGYVKDAATGEDLLGATVLVEELGSGTVTNLYGFYSLTLPKAAYNLKVTYVGYDVISQTIDLNDDIKLNVSLPLALSELAEIVITDKAENQNVVSTEMSVQRLESQTIKDVPSVLGEPDVLKSIQLLPGVTSVADGASGFNVRGGSADQNLILLDEGILYNASHLLGLYSVVNPDAIKDVILYKGGIPSRYGGRLSSVLDIRQREGNNQQFEGEGGIGLVSARLLAEGPIVKDKGSFMVAGRRSYGDAFLALAGNDNVAYFYDLNVKANYNINEKNRVFLSGYFGRDKFELGNIFSNGWGNATSTLRWNHLFSDKLFANFSAVYSNYDYSIGSLAVLNWRG
ncbi:MAG: TonB-dependent receptor, partial [Bacteroidota bacterium]